MPSVYPSIETVSVHVRKKQRPSGKPSPHAMPQQKAQLCIQILRPVIYIVLSAITWNEA